GRLSCRPATGICRIDSHNPIALHHSGLLGGGVGEDALHCDETLTFSYLHSDATLPSARLFIECRELLRRQKHGIGVVQLTDKPARGLLVQSARVDTVHEASGN